MSLSVPYAPAAVALARAATARPLLLLIVALAGAAAAALLLGAACAQRRRGRRRRTGSGSGIAAGLGERRRGGTGSHRSRSGSDARAVGTSTRRHSGAGAAPRSRGGSRYNSNNYDVLNGSGELRPPSASFGLGAPQPAADDGGRASIYGHVAPAVAPRGGGTEATAYTAAPGHLFTSLPGTTPTLTLTPPTDVPAARAYGRFDVYSAVPGAVLKSSPATATAAAAGARGKDGSPRRGGSGGGGGGGDDDGMELDYEQNGSAGSAGIDAMLATATPPQYQKLQLAPDTDGEAAADEAPCGKIAVVDYASSSSDDGDGDVVV